MLKGRIGVIAVVIVAYNRRPELLQSLSSLLQLPSNLLGTIQIYDNSKTRTLGKSDLKQMRTRSNVSVEYDWDGVNAGIPRRLDQAFEELHRKYEAILVLDDDTVIARENIEDLLEALGSDVRIAAATIPTRETLRAGWTLHRLRYFPWSPTLLRTSAIATAGKPLGDLFFSYDDWEYADRLRELGFRIVGVPSPLPRQTLNEVWLGRTYLGARNLTWLITRGHLISSPVLMSLGRYVLNLLHFWVDARSSRAIALGIWDGLVGRLGIPRAEYMKP